MRKPQGRLSRKLVTACFVLSAMTAGSTLAAHGANTKKLVFGLSVPNMAYPYVVSLVGGFRNAAKAAGVKTVVTNARSSLGRQANDIDDLLARGVNGIAINPLNGVVSEGWVDKVAAHGIPIVAGGTQVGNPATRQLRDVYPKLNALVMSDDVKAGEISGRTAARLLPKGKTAKIAVVEGAPSYAVVAERLNGFQEGLKKAGVKYKIVAKQPTNWTAEQGESVCQNMLTAHPNINLILSEADDMAVGCAHAIAAAHSKAILLSAAGGKRQGIQDVKDGKIAGSVCVRPAIMGRLMFKALLAAADGTDKKKGRFITYPIFEITKANTGKCQPDW